MLGGIRNIFVILEEIKSQNVLVTVNGNRQAFVSVGYIMFVYKRLTYSE